MTKRMVKKLFLCKKVITLILLGVTSNTAISDTKTDGPPRTGNFALPTSQQPGAFLSFGQNILDKNQAQLSIAGTDSIGANQRYLSLIPNYVYQISDTNSILFALPIAADYQSTRNHSAGFGDAGIQLEHIFYSKQTTQFVTLGTIVLNITLPTGSATKQPSTGIGAPSFFGGFTFNKMNNDWYGFTSDGVSITTARNGNKFGNTFLYQFGLGKNLSSQYKKLIIDGLVELNGTFSQKDRVNGVIDSNSGGNTINVIPSIWISSPNFIFQFGIGFPIVQDLNGDQGKIKYLVAANVSYTFK